MAFKVYVMIIIWNAEELPSFITIKKLIFYLYFRVKYSNYLLECSAEVVADEDPTVKATFF